MITKKIYPEYNFDFKMSLKENIVDILFLCFLSTIIALGSTLLLSRIFA